MMYTPVFRELDASPKTNGFESYLEGEAAFLGTQLQGPAGGWVQRVHK